MVATALHSVISMCSGKKPYFFFDEPRTGVGIKNIVVLSCSVIVVMCLLIVYAVLLNDFINAITGTLKMQMPSTVRGQQTDISCITRFLFRPMCCDV